MATANIESVFRSSRLTYRAVEDTPEDKAFMHEIQSNVVGQANSDFELLRPMTTKDSLSHHNYVANKTLLGVIICVPTLPIPIGSLYLTAPRQGHEHHRNSAISIDIIPAYQGKGYGSEALEWSLDWAFRIAGLHRVMIETFSYNEGARRLYERLGFVYEGCKRECVWFNGGWHDFLTFGMLEQEWTAKKERKELVVAKDVKKE